MLHTVNTTKYPGAVDIFSEPGMWPCEVYDGRGRIIDLQIEAFDDETGLVIFQIMNPDTGQAIMDHHNEGYITDVRYFPPPLTMVPMYQEDGETIDHPQRERLRRGLQGDRRVRRDEDAEYGLWYIPVPPPIEVFEDLPPLQSLPLPITHQDVTFPARFFTTKEATLDTRYAEEMGRREAERIERAVLDNFAVPDQNITQAVRAVSTINPTAPYRYTVITTFTPIDPKDLENPDGSPDSERD